uniref:Alpha/beta hydrolase fold-3 domain-containing protein n=1 Tax=Canis lupus familiaris TaxID=9615 RepID=A0A8C0QHV6_CANLF
MLWGWAGVEGRVWCISAGASPAPALARGRSRTASRRAAGAGAAMALLLLVLQAACAFSLGVGLWVVCSHLLRADVPAAVGHPVRLRVLHCLLELLITWGMILEKLRICSMPQFVRFVHDLVPLKEDPDVVVTDLLFGTVPVKLYQPKGLSCTPRPGIVFYHGGGAVMGSLKTHYAICCHLCKKSGSVVLAVGYRKLPQHKFPAALTDCFAATTHFLKSLNVYGVDPDRVVVCGDSVGGAVATLPSYQQNKNVPLASRDFAFYCWHRYLDIKPSWKSTVLKGAHLPAEVWEKYRKWLGTENIPERFKKRPYRPVLPEPLNEAAYLETSLALDLLNSPLIAEDEVISQLPEACIVSCEYDLLRDDSLLYKKRLEDLGVPVTWYHMEDGFHGVLSTLDMGCLQFPCSTRILDSLVHFLKRL